jgi:hypothetical protein
VFGVRENKKNYLNRQDCRGELRIRKRGEGLGNKKGKKFCGFIFLPSALLDNPDDSSYFSYFP